MNKICLALVLLICNYFSGITQIKYSTSWFGPHANPVPELSDGNIPEFTEIRLQSSYIFNSGDQTYSTNLNLEIPLISKFVSVKLWSEVFEYYRVSENIKNNRKMIDTSGYSTGDIYFQTRIKLLKEKTYLPQLILNSTLKTASGSNFLNRRYFDTPGYYFDLEITKQIKINSLLIDKINITGDLGFMCWETTGSTQNDAIMYAVQTSFYKRNTGITFFFGGYDGWMHRHPAFGSDYGDSPLILSAKMHYTFNNLICYLKYLKGIKDYPYQMINVGITIPVEKLTPVFK